MSNAAATAARFYVVTLSAAEVESVEAHLGRALGAKPAPAPRKAATEAEVFEPNTGDPALDDFMRRSRARRGAPKPRRRPPVGVKPPKRLTVAEFEAEEAAWAAYAATGKADGNAYPVTEYVAAFSRHVAVLDALGARA